jgi:hypothetical protein
LLESGQLKTADWYTDLCNALAKRLVNAGTGDADVLKWLFENDKLQTNDWIAYECNKLAIALAKAEKDGVELLKQLLNDGKLPQFQLKGENGYEASKKKALELLGQNPPGLDELSGLIPDVLRESR